MTKSKLKLEKPVLDNRSRQKNPKDIVYKLSRKLPELQTRPIQEVNENIHSPKKSTQ